MICSDELEAHIEWNQSAIDNIRLVLKKMVLLLGVIAVSSAPQGSTVQAKIEPIFIKYSIQQRSLILSFLKRKCLTKLPREVV